MGPGRAAGGMEGRRRQLDLGHEWESFDQLKRVVEHFLSKCGHQMKSFQSVTGSTKRHLLVSKKKVFFSPLSELLYLYGCTKAKYFQKQ